MKNELLITGLVGAIFMGLATQSMAAGEHGFKGKQGPRHSFEELDADGDGLITEAEMVAHREARFAEVDANGDGSVSRDEMLAQAEKRQAERRARMIDHMIERHDADGDGALTMEEMLHGRQGRMFAMADSNGDGAISREEFEEMRQHRHGRHGMSGETEQ